MILSALFKFNRSQVNAITGICSNFSLFPNFSDLSHLSLSPSNRHSDSDAELR